MNAYEDVKTALLHHLTAEMTSAQTLVEKHTDEGVVQHYMGKRSAIFTLMEQISTLEDPDLLPDLLLEEEHDCEAQTKIDCLIDLLNKRTVGGFEETMNGYVISYLTVWPGDRREKK